MSCKTALFRIQAHVPLSGEVQYKFQQPLTKHNHISLHMTHNRPAVKSCVTASRALHMILQNTLEQVAPGKIQYNNNNMIRRTYPLLTMNQEQQATSSRMKQPNLLYTLTTLIQNQYVQPARNTHARTHAHTHHKTRLAMKTIFSPQPCYLQTQVQVRTLLTRRTSKYSKWWDNSFWC